ncbi:MAG TPA: hypothetical protein VK671_11460 [Mucilaginibacter sp.]|jgi:hypothetical protein|nr:hypothetical protein [Mucilaginibacter sp.]
MTKSAGPYKRTEINSDVSEFIWDVKTKRYKRNPYFKRNNPTRYILWAVIILIILVFVAWYLR